MEQAAATLSFVLEQSLISLVGQNQMQLLLIIFVLLIFHVQLNARNNHEETSAVMNAEEKFKIGKEMKHERQLP